MTPLNLAITCFLGLLLSSTTLSAEQPNVLLIAIDDLNDWVGCLGGHPQAQTPHINALAIRGTLFTNAHCQSPICNPSRTSVMLGLRRSTTGIYRNSPWFRLTERNRDRVTLPQYFREHGYETLPQAKSTTARVLTGHPSRRLAPSRVSD
jgi:arylsulfatase A-like enzyme